MNKTWRRCVSTSVVTLLMVLLFIPGATHLGPIPIYGTDTVPTAEDSNETVPDTDPSEGERRIEESCSCPNRFSDHDDLAAYVRSTTEEYGGIVYPRFGQSGTVILSGFTETVADAGNAGPRDYSTTNVQVEGVDEPDIVKTDGEYLYVVSEREVVIARAYPGKDAEILSRIVTERGADEIFVQDSRLIMFERYGWRNTSVVIYNISSRSSPEFVDNISITGRYVDSRMIGDYVYIVASSSVGYYSFDDEVYVMPTIANGNSTRTVQASEICYFDEPSPGYLYTIVVSINVHTEEVSYGVFLTDVARTIYVSEENIYLTSFAYHNWLYGSDGEYRERTNIHKISIEERRIEYVAKGEVPGRVLNQFSMDEHEGHFRIATTEGHVSRIESSSESNVYVLDGKLNIVGRLEGLAQGERIYSARFIGNRCYLVTFKKVDPFFVIDLSKRTNPKVLGELKIPGFSDYLHPYDENHIIGLGKDTVEAEEGDFAWFQGVKLSMFDVTDVRHPREIYKYVIGHRGTTSEALNDHKAFMFSRSKNLLIIPILLAEIDETKYPNGVPPNAFGEYVWNGAYVFSVTLRCGFQLKGRISHAEGELTGYGRYYYGPSSVRRSFYIEESIYTVSESLVRIHRMDSLKEIKTLRL